MKENNQDGEVGVVAGIVIVVIVLVVGAVYFFGQRLEKQKQIESLLNGSTEISTTSSNTISTSSDDIGSLQKEASSVNFDDLGKGIDSL
ncbi:MAG: hypothetical protein WCX27_00060 [Candidatus Paceibacterota bacterium]|jgi:ABC-type lipoprotein release transport system permease subunit